MYFRKWIVKSSISVKSYRTIELNKFLLKSLLSTDFCSNLQRFYFYFVLKNYSKNISVSCYRRFCVLTHHPKAVFRFFKLSRHFAKKYASDGLLLGMRKSSF